MKRFLVEIGGVEGVIALVLFALAIIAGLLGWVDSGAIWAARNGGS